VDHNVLFVVEVSEKRPFILWQQWLLRFIFYFSLFYQWFNMLTRLISRRVSMIWHLRLSTKWTHHSFGRRLVMPLLTQYTLLDRHSTATITNRAGRAQTTTTDKVPTVSLLNTTPKHQEILVLNKDQIFTNLQASHIDYQLIVIYARLKTGYIKHALRAYRKSITRHPDQKERLNNVNIYNAFIEVYMMKGDGRSTYHALKWFDEMRKQQIKPNSTTYTLLIKGFIRSGSVNRAQTLLMEMLKEGYNISAFMLNRNISNNDLEMLNLIHKAREGNYFEISSAQINKLLSSMGNPTTESTETPASLSSVLEAKSTNVLDIHLLKDLLVPVATNDTKLYERQLHFEEQSVTASIERLRAVAEAQETSSNSYSLQSLMWSWHQKLYPIVVEEQQHACNFFGKTSKYVCGLFLSLLDAEKLSMLVIQQLLRLSMDRDMENDISVTYAASEIGNAIEMEYYTKQLCKCKNDLVKARRFNLQTLYSSGQLFDMHTRKIQAKLLGEEEEDRDWLERWPKKLRIKMGALLISMLLRVAKIKTTYYDKETGKYV
jgi:DNA-directed RNA polymerase